MELTVPLNDKVNATVANGVLTLNSSAGFSKVLKYNIHWMDVAATGGSLVIKTIGKETRNKVAAARAMAAHARNASAGLTYPKKLQIVYAHFPVTVEVKGATVLFKNFLGEKKPRQSKIVGKAKVEIKGQEITVTGTNIEDVGQTASNLRQATRITNKDIRVFQDGVYYMT